MKLIYAQFPGYIEDSYFDIYKCNNCNTHFILTQEDLSEIYEKIYSVNSLPGYDRYFNYAQKIKDVEDPLKYLAYEEATYFPVYDYLKNKKKLKILEVGCGYGYLSYAIKKSGMDITGIDISGEAINYARSNFGNFYTQSNIENLDPAKNKYDVIIATELIEHLIDPNEFLKKCRELLKDEGVILLTTPDKDYYPSNHIWNTDRPPVHITWLTHRAFYSLAQANSMKITYTSFKKYFPSYENRLIKFIRTRKDNPGVAKFTSEGNPLPQKNQEDFSPFHNFVSFILHKFFLIRFPSNLIYNLISGNEKTMGIILRNED